MSTISIIGLGWIGLPLATVLSEKHSVCGSTTTAEKADQLKKSGINAIHFSLEPFPKGEGFQQLFNSEILVVNIPPKSRTSSGEYYLEQIKFLKSMVDQSDIKKVIFVSSTGVYPSVARPEPYSESEALNKESTGNQTIYQSEVIFSEDKTYDLTIVRFGGLLGDNRIPGNYIANKEHVAGHTRVNFIYRNDAVKMLAWIIEHELWNTIYNGIAPIHPKRKEVYERNIKDLNLTPPKSYQEERENEDRLISGEKILATGFKFEYPNPVYFPYSKDS